MIAPFPTQPGTILRDRYILQEVLYSGHWSLTLRAHRQPDNKSVILKVPGPGSAQSGANLAFHAAWMQRVFHSLSTIHHPHRVAVLDYLESHGYPVLVQQDVAGKPISHRLVKSALGEREAIAIIRKIAIALSGVHGKGLIHRNVRPEAILERTGREQQGFNASQSGQPILTDWGLQPSVFPGNRASSYAAPEQFQPGGRFQPGIDVYGLAGTLYALVTGQPPQHGALRTKSPLVPPRQLQPQLSVALERAIIQGLALHPQERPPSMGAWLALLPEVSMPSVVQSLSRPEPTPSRPETVGVAPAIATGTATLAVENKTLETKAASASDAPSPAPRKPMRTLVLISLTASVLGSLGGLALRITTPESIAGISSIGRPQDFPERDWPGGSMPEEIPFEAPAFIPDSRWQDDAASEFEEDDYDSPEPEASYPEGRESLREVVVPEEVEEAPILSPRDDNPWQEDLEPGYGEPGEEVRSYREENGRGDYRDAPRDERGDRLRDEPEPSPVSGAAVSEEGPGDASPRDAYDEDPYSGYDSDVNDPVGGEATYPEEPYDDGGYYGEESYVDDYADTAPAEDWQGSPNDDFYDGQPAYGEVPQVPPPESAPAEAPSINWGDPVTGDDGGLTGEPLPSP